MMWYYADYEMRVCYNNDPELANWMEKETECSRWRRFIK